MLRTEHPNRKPRRIRHPPLHTWNEAVTGQCVTGGRQDHPIRGSIAKERVIAALEKTMVRSDKQVHDFWKHRNHPDPRTAAFLHVIERVAESCTHHGIFP